MNRTSAPCAPEMLEPQETGAYSLIHGVWPPQKSGTQDFIYLDPDFPWKPGEIATLQQQIADLSGRPLRRVQYVVTTKRRFYEPYTVLDVSHAWLRGLHIEMKVYIGHSHCARRTDWMICRAAMEVFAPLARSWHMRKLASLKRANDSKRLPLRVRRGTAWGGSRKYRGVYTRVATQFDLHPDKVRDVGMGATSDPEILSALYAEVARIDRGAIA